jgi:hypothetical protein
MYLEDKQEWAEAYDKEYRGLMERNALKQIFKMVRPEKGIEIQDTLMRLEYKEDNRTFLRREVRLCKSEDQQVESESFTLSDLYAPTLKAPEARLLAATAPKYVSRY